MRVQQLAPVDAAAYRSLMLEAYEKYADAFTSTVAERATLPLSWWEERIAGGKGNSVAFGAFAGDTLAGAAGLEFVTREKARHKASLFGMYVRATYRGQGAGRKLVEAVLECAKARPGTSVVQLTVSEGNTSAQALYESCGFRVFGVEPQAMRVNGGYLGKVHMWCALPEPDATGHNPSSA